jgi:hypothetical protein
MFSLPANVLLLLAFFRLHNFCIEHGEVATGAVLGPEERSVSAAAFQRWFRDSQQARLGQLPGSLQGRSCDLERSHRRDTLTRGLREIGTLRPRKNWNLSSESRR